MLLSHAGNPLRAVYAAVQRWQYAQEYRALAGHLAYARAKHT